jgi:fructokinase
VTNVLDPDAMVPEFLGPHVFSDVATTPIVRAKYGESSGVRGAAWLWRPDEAAAGLPSDG